LLDYNSQVGYAGLLIRRGDHHFQRPWKTALDFQLKELTKAKGGELSGIAKSGARTIKWPPQHLMWMDMVRTQTRSHWPIPFELSYESAQITHPLFLPHSNPPCCCLCEFVKWHSLLNAGLLSQKKFQIKKRKQTPLLVLYMMIYNTFKKCSLLRSF
jgi:hypothetical protein